MDELNNTSDFGEYVTFTITAKDGNEVEMAVVDEFEFEKKNYIVAALVKDDAIDDEGQYIYRCHITEDGFKAEKISNALDYERITKAYMEMED